MAAPGQTVFEKVEELVGRAEARSSESLDTTRNVRHFLPDRSESRQRTRARKVAAAAAEVSDA